MYLEFGGVANPTYALVMCAWGRLLVCQRHRTVPGALTGWDVGRLAILAVAGVVGAHIRPASLVLSKEAILDPNDVPVKCGFGEPLRVVRVIQVLLAWSHAGV
jgi:hypothetical protein